MKNIILKPLFLISASSGVGKTSLVKRVIGQVSSSYAIERIVTYTSRSPRATDVLGSDYHFITEDEFLKKIKENFFLEWSVAYGAYYGTPSRILKDLTAKSLIAIVDIAGAQALKQIVPHATALWIAAPSLKEIEARLLKRGSEVSEERDFRLALAEKEAAFLKENSFLFNYFVINHDFETAALKINQILLLELERSMNSCNEKRPHFKKDEDFSPFF